MHLNVLFLSSLFAIYKVFRGMIQKGHRLTSRVVSNELVLCVRILDQTVFIIVCAYYAYRARQEAKAPRQSIPRKEAQIAMHWMGADFILYVIAHAALLK